MGRHARGRGQWFNPVPWVILAATVLFIVLAMRQIPCVQTDATNPINAFIRLCYTDIPLTYTGQGFGLGKKPFGGETMNFPPVLAVFLLACVRIAAALGADVRDGIDDQAQFDGAQLFFAVNAVLLFVAFLVWVLCMVLLGRESRGGKYRSWDAMLVAASPVVLAAGLISWDLLPIALTAVGLLQFAQRRVLEAGIVLGLAAATGTMPIAVVFAVAAAILLRGTRGQLATFGLAALGTWFVVHIPLLLKDWTKVLAFYQSQIAAEMNYGSLWYLFQVFGWKVRSAGSLGFIVLLLALGGTVAWLYIKRIRPRVGTLIAIFIFLTIMLGPSFPPQNALWLLFALVLARPFRPELLAFTLTQLGYYLAIWGFLSGHLTVSKNGPENLYFLALGLRFAVEAWLLFQFYADMVRPARDPLRAPDHSDPLGGVLVDGEELAPLSDADLVSAA